MQSWFWGEQLNKHVEILSEKAQFSLSTQWRQRRKRNVPPFILNLGTWRSVSTCQSVTNTNAILIIKTCEAKYSQCVRNNFSNSLPATRFQCLTASCTTQSPVYQPHNSNDRCNSKEQQLTKTLRGSHQMQDSKLRDATLRAYLTALKVPTQCPLVPMVKICWKQGRTKK